MFAVGFLLGQQGRELGRAEPPTEGLERPLLDADGVIYSPPPQGSYHLPSASASSESESCELTEGHMV